ncbi:ATP-binding protein [Saccharothrix sp. ALI-22-I]|uniref:ATP-binding protein n=1 Tax=Saccharothrix sp. ALI-22-I TaxID=1933778 RepID=UPI0009FF6BA7|nr:ATP-binding protein [Saccharothrix sp. ALI-22-I]
MNMVELPEDGLDLELGGTPSLDGIGVWVRQVAYEVDEQRVADLASIAAELVGNARRHAEGPWRVRLWRTDDRQVMRVEVEDRSPSLLPVLGRADNPSLGNGLLLVNRLSVHWGFDRHDDRKVVWAEVPTR